MTPTETTATTTTTTTVTTIQPALPRLVSSCYDSDSDTEEPNFFYALASPTTTADYTAHSSPILPSAQSPDVNQIHQRETTVVPDISLLQEPNFKQTIPTTDT